MTELANTMGLIGKELGTWVRLHYVYPYPHVDEVIPLMADGIILPYLDVPLQHASPRVLKAMKRPGNIDKILQRIENWRNICPDITLRSTFIVGFPGETDRDFDILLDFLREAQLDRVGCFQYSPVHGAKANDLPNHVPDEVKQERWERFMALQQEISRDKLRDKIGTVQEILIDTVDEQGAIGRTMGDAPEIDGKVYLDGITDLQPGDFVEAQINSADDYDLWAG